MKRGRKRTTFLAMVRYVVWLSLHDLVMWTTMAVASVRLSLNSEPPITATAMVNAFAEKESSIHEDDDDTALPLVLSVVPLKLKFTLLRGALHPPLPDRHTISNLPLPENRENVKRGRG